MCVVGVGERLPAGGAWLEPREWVAKTQRLAEAHTPQTEKKQNATESVTPLSDDRAEESDDDDTTDAPEMNSRYKRIYSRPNETPVVPGSTRRFTTRRESSSSSPPVAESTRDRPRSSSAPRERTASSAPVVDPLLSELVDSSNDSALSPMDRQYALVKEYYERSKQQVRAQSLSFGGTR